MKQLLFVTGICLFGCNEIMAGKPRKLSNKGAQGRVRQAKLEKAQEAELAKIIARLSLNQGLDNDGRKSRLGFYKE